ncbi:SRPBCC family protein [Sphaerisporangium album]|uniref:SRPBCC family protein n=1 Tax=Sphaerisporangium album TaxID=509200 RepID=A0A367FCH8_9ACTN|nr:SRPBCC family protein [Sphaerisporangium album]RCG27290.1 SRPBCC family protein [Sphaerisporangium album]
MSEKNHRTHERLATTLGWASLGLGVAQLAAPGAISRLSGLDDSPWAGKAIRLVGIRELLHAAALLGTRRPAPMTWTRVAGDAMDLTMLGRAMANRDGPRRRRVAAASAAVAGITLADMYTAMRANRPMPGAGPEPITNLRASITVNRPRQEVYRFWRSLENLPRFMIHLESVETIGGGYSHWKVRGPAHKVIEWDAEIVEDREEQLIAWRSIEGATVRNSGWVRFTDAPGGRGTEVRVRIDYEAPAGKLGLAFARLLGEHPEQQVRDDLRRFKQVMETGEVTRSEGSPEGTRAQRQLFQRPAQPVR